MFICRPLSAGTKAPGAFATAAGLEVQTRRWSTGRRQGETGVVFSHVLVLVWVSVCTGQAVGTCSLLGLLGLAWLACLPASLGLACLPACLLAGLSCWLVLLTCLADLLAGLAWLASWLAGLLRLLAWIDGLIDSLDGWIH